MPHLSLRRVSKSFVQPGLVGESRPVIVDLSLEIPDGTFAAIMGPSGCGKSTLLNLLAALDTPTTGEIWVGQTAVHQLTGSQADVYRLQRTGFVFQFFHLLPTLSLLENSVLAAFQKYPKDKAPTLKRAKDLFARMALQDFIDYFPGEVSGGMQQRAALVRAVLSRPELILADEPTGNLDSRTGAEVMNLLKEFQSEFGTTVVMVTHDVACAKMASQVFEMRDGKLKNQLAQSLK